MSRIHDALKQAAQERQDKHPTNGISSVLDPAISPTMNEERGAVNTEMDIFGETVITRPSRTEVLPFDDLRTHCTRPVWDRDPNSNVFIRAVPDAHATEQFRTLRSRLYQLRSDQPLRTLLVTSSVSGEGKTFVSNNLAHAIVRKTDQRALLIDADLRCPRLHKVLGAPAAPGLIDYLNGTADQMTIIQQGPDEGLCFIPAGNEVTNPSELLSNGKLKILLDRLTPLFDWVILDSPPCLPVADASVLANICDGVLLVMRAKSTPAAAIQKACQQLEERNVVGVVLNGANEAHSYDSSYYYKASGE
jgi:capsular exopolysaccharide synthesis family protein